MTKVEFKFDVDQEVVTAFESKGIVSLLGYDDGGNQYYVKTQKGSTWFKEKQLKSTDEYLPL